MSGAERNGVQQNAEQESRSPEASTTRQVASEEASPSREKQPEQSSTAIREKQSEDVSSARDIPLDDISSAREIPLDDAPSTTKERPLERRTSAYSLTLSQYMECMEMRESKGYQVYPGTEREEYDFSAERLSVNATNFIESTAHLVKGCLGAGILSMHEAYMFAGLWTALVLTVVLGLIMSHTMMMLVKSAQKMYHVLRLPRLTYPDLVEVAVATGPWKGLRCFSKCFRYAVDICLFFQMCGTCCIYEIMIANTLKGVLEAVSSTLNESNFNIRVYILIISIPLMSICLIRSLKYLAPFAMIADTFAAICVLTTIYYSLRQAQHISNRPAWKNFNGLVRFFGICLYSMDGIGVTLPVENNMAQPRYFHMIVAYGMAIVIISISITGFFGYWGWGEACKSPVTVHMPMTDTLPIVLQFLMAAMLSVTFSVNFWVPFRVVWHYIGRKYKRNRGFWERIYRAIHVSLITAFTMVFPHLIHLIIFIGNFSLVAIAFVFPPLIESLVTWKDDSSFKGNIRWRFIKNCAIILFGFTISISTFVSYG